MISTGIDKRVKVHQIIENQLPEFVLSESPKTADFLKQYYISQEYTSGSIDLVDNLDQYLKLDNLTQSVISGTVTLSSDINSTADVITISSNNGNPLDGFPKEYGLLKIGNEIITYTGVAGTDTFTGCQRGFSGITSYRNVNNPSEIVFEDSAAESHTTGDKVQNLSVLFLQEFYKKLKKTFTPGLENSDFVSELDVNNFIKEARTFYESKGTEESFRILFNVLYGVTPKVIDLEKYLVKPSSARYLRRERIVAERLSGDPLKLQGQTIVRSTDSQTTASISEVEVFTGITGASNTKEYFILDIFVGYSDEEFITGTFNVTGKTKVIEPVSNGSSVITVDSTIGFGATGTVISGDNTSITYTDKTVNQFLNCSGINNPIEIGSDLIVDDKVFGYENGDLTKKVELRLTGVLKEFVPSPNNKLSLEGEPIIIKSIGELIKNPNTDKTNKEIFANSWIYNTSSTYEIIDGIDGSQSKFTLKSTIDKSSLKKGDTVQFLEITSHPFSLGTVLDTDLEIIEINQVENSITLNKSISSLKRTKRYVVRRLLKKASSSNNLLQFGNNILTSDIQNVYNESDESLYVASNSLPSYQISEDISQVNISTISTSNLEDYNSITFKYSTLSFDVDNIPFVTGDKVFYKPEGNPLVGLSTGVYYVKTIGTQKIKLYQSPAFIESNSFIEFGIPKITTTSHSFTLNDHYDKKITSQKILKKFPINVKQNLGKKVKTIPGSVGMLIDGVEIENARSKDSIFYGPISKFSSVGFGTGYDIINPPLIDISSTGSEQALVSPVISGDVREIMVDPQNFDIESVKSVKITGGNSEKAILLPILTKRNRVLEFSGVTTAFGGGIDTSGETLTFIKPHNLVDGQVLIYDSNKNTPLGIGIYKGSNLTTSESLVDGQQYWPRVVGASGTSSTIQLYRNENDYISGINTVGFTEIAKDGIHKFKLRDSKNYLKGIRVIESGKPYLNRKVYVNPSIGISTEKSTISFDNHGFSDGELVTYEASVGLGSTTPQSISGLTTTNQYKVLKIDDNTFRLSNVGVDGTDNTDFISRKYVSFKSKGTGYQLIKYPNIEVTVDALYSLPDSLDKITLTPVVQGEIIDISLYQKGDGYGSKNVINYKNIPDVLIKNGTSRPGKNITPSITPLIVNGKIFTANIQDGGAEYYSTPDLEVIGDGVGAKLRAVVDRNENSQTYLKIIDVVILNGGINYTFDKTRINVVPRGKNAVFNVSIDELSLNNIQTLEPYKAKYSNEKIISSNDGLKYSVVGYSTQIGEDQYGQLSGNHSPIIGWAYDGNPIYGPYGYSDPLDNSSLVKILKTGYSLNSTIKNRSDLPFDVGFFADDYSYTPSDITDLDEHNGRFCKTPEYPNGVYAYFVGINTVTEEPEYPYFVGHSYRSIPETLDSESTLSQSFDFNNSNLIRNTFPYKISDDFARNDFIIESDEIVSQLTKVTAVSTGKVDSLNIVKPGNNYKIGDNITFDNRGTDGSGVSAFVSKLDGKSIFNIDTSYESLSNVTFLWKNQNTLSVFVPNTHQLSVGDNIEVSGLTTDISSLDGKSLLGNKIISGITTESTVLYKELASNGTAGVIADIYVYQTNAISVGSSIGIGTEKLLVLNKFDDRNILRVKRGVTGTAHTLSSKVNLIPSFFDINFKTTLFNSKLDDIVYFNPRQSIGIGTTSGVSTEVTVSVGDTSRQVSVPAQSIYLPNHPFKTGQAITFKKPPSGGLSISVSRDGSVGQQFSLPLSGSSQTVFAINKSKDYIGIVTQVGLTTTNGLFFRTNGDNDFEYTFESNFTQITGNLERINSKVTLTTSHSLFAGDIVSLNVKPNQSVGIGTSVSARVKYNSLTDSLLINQIGFSSLGINTSTNIITINSHGLKTGDKVYYDAEEVASGLETGGYFTYKVSDNQIKLAETLYNSNIIPPKVVNLVSVGGTHTLALINPPISIIRNNNLVFDLSDSSLSGLDFKIYYDQNFNNNFVSTGSTTVNVVSTAGTIGVTSTASLTINYSDNNPQNLFYNVEKSGFISTSDIDVVNSSRISYIDSKYNNDYSIVGIGTTTFDIRLSNKPENLLYNSDNTNTLKYSTNSKTEKGSINDINLTFGGEGYKALPKFVSVATTTGSNAKIIPDSTTSNKIKNSEIFNIGFEYSSDKTLKPIADISPVITTKNADKINSITVIDGGKDYLTPPNLIILDSESKEIVNSGFIQSKISQATQSISSVDIVSTPKGIGECQIFAKDNTNGVQITNISIGSTIITNEVTGIVTFTLATPILGFSSAPFKVGDTLFVENVENEYGNTFNSPDNQFKFYPVTRIVGGINPNPFKLEINLNGLVSNPGLAKTLQTYGSIVNYNNYPKFSVVTDLSPFSEGETILVSRNNQPFEKVGLTLNKISNNFIKITGRYDLKVNDKIQGLFTGSIATINSLFENKGEFLVDYSSRKNKGWSDDIGKLNEDFQLLPDNDYYQNLSYTIQSPIEYQKLVSPVNKLLHTTGLKNFADVGISSAVGIALTSSVDSSSIIRELSSENRVDVIDNFDFVRDSDILISPRRSRFIKFQNKKLANYFECNTNNVIQIDDISTLFSDSSNNAKLDGSLPITNSFNRFLVQVRVPLSISGIAQTTNTLQVTEIITSVDFINKDIYTIEKSSINDENKLVDITGSKDINDNYSLQFNPVDAYNKDLDIKILENDFISGVGVGTFAIGFVNLTGKNTIVSSSTTSTIISSNINTLESYFATISINDDIANENNVIDLYVTHDGTNSYISNYSLETNTGNSIGTFTSKIDSGVLSLNYENDRSNQVFVKSKIVGFGTTASGIGTYRFNIQGQPDGSENSGRLESKWVSIGSTATICGFDTSKDTTIKSIVKVSIGNTSALHQVLTAHDGTNTVITQYPFMSIGSNAGIGTFSSEYSGSNFNLKFHPDSEFIGVGNLQVQTYNEVLNTDLDLINIPPVLTYGKSSESLSLLQYNSINGDRSEIGAFKLRNNNNPIFSNFFNPSIDLNTTTGEFTINNNFFNRNERLIYTPGSSLESVGIASLIMSDGNPLPSEVYVSLDEGTINSNVFKISLTRGGAPLTFNSIGSGNRHQLEMFKKNEKSLITLDNVIQSPLSFTPITTTLDDNVNSQVSITTSIISLSGITSIVTNDILKINEEYVVINNVGLGTTNIGPIVNYGSLNLIDVTRASMGSTSTTHADGSNVRLFKGGYNIVGDSIFFSNAPRGTNVLERDESNRDPGRSSFSGRAFLRQNYSTNAIFDDVSHQFTGIAQTFRTSISGVNTTGLTTGSSFLTINGIFQRPTTEQNPLNNYDFSESAGITSFVFSGISSSDGTQIISESDINQNQLPRSGQIISIGYSGGLGYAPLAGSAVTAITNSSGTITAVEGFHGSGYRSGLSTTGDGILRIEVIDEAYDHRFSSSSTNSITVKSGGIGADTTFTPTDAPYTSSTGIVTLTKNNHGLITSDSHTATTGTLYNPTTGVLTIKLNSSPSPALSNGQLVRFDNNSLTFTCEKDVHATNHRYPRTTDPVSGKWLPISNVTGGDQFDINVLETIPSSNTGIHTFVEASPNGVKRSANKIRIATSSLIYTCDKDAHATDHTYPRSTDPAYSTDLDIFEATDNYFTVGVGTGGGVGSGANITATVGVGGTLIYSIADGGTGYINPVIMSPSPSYENLPVIGVSRLGIGATTDTGIGLLLTIDVGGSNTTGIGSTLFEVKEFKVPRSGYGFRKGDKFKPVGLVTDKSLSSPLSEVEFTVNEIFTDSFSSWNVGEFDYIDDITYLQDGTRTVFPLYFNDELVSFESKSGSSLDMQSLLLIFVNGVLQNPGESYIFDGGTSFQFTEPPDNKDDIAIFFYKGTNDVDVTFVDVKESIKVGDELQILRRNGGNTEDQNVRTISGITTADTVETELYYTQGIDDINFRPVRWIKQKSDKFVNGRLITKVRPLIEPLVFPDARIIKDVAPGDSTIYLDNINNFFSYDSPTKVSTLVIDDAITRQSANLDAVVSAAGTIQSVTITDGGSGYVGATTSISIGIPITGITTFVKGDGTVGTGETATATASITAGIITNITITNPGLGYTSSSVPSVIAPVPVTPYETISGFSGSAGFSGIVTGITVLSSSTIKFFLEKESGTFSDLSNGDPVCIFDTSVGSGVTSTIISSGAPVGVGTTFFDNIYIVSSLSSSSNVGEFIAGVTTDTSIVGIATENTICGRFSWGKLTGGTRSSNPLTLTVSGKTVNSGLSTFPKVQRRSAGLRETGAIKDST